MKGSVGLFVLSKKTCDQEVLELKRREINSILIGALGTACTYVYPTDPFTTLEPCHLSIEKLLFSRKPSIRGF